METINLADHRDKGVSENVCVAVRIRPLNQREIDQRCGIITSVNKNSVTLHTPNCINGRYEGRIFRYDHIFTEECTQKELYDKVAASLVRQIFKGYNGTILAYGQTGSGKTYTMTGHDGYRGVIPNTFRHIFEEIEQQSEVEKRILVNATYLEIYNEEVRDLLAPNPDKKLQVRERVDIGVYVQGLTGCTVDSTDAIMAMMTFGNRNRKTRCTAMNDVSSRSHTIFGISITTLQKSATTVAKLNLVDLAGSERLNRSRVTGMGLKETSCINQSLFVLSNVISALVEGENTHVPYRNSKLTRLLQCSLGGNSKTTMIATISPSLNDYDETLCTLRYASRAKLIKNYVKLNSQPHIDLMEQLQKQFLELQKKFAALLLTEEQMIMEKKRKAARRAKRREMSLQLDEELYRTEEEKEKLISSIHKAQFNLLVAGIRNGSSVDDKDSTDVSSHLDTDSTGNSSRMDTDTSLDLELLAPRIVNLQEESDILDEKIAELEAMINEAAGQYEDEKAQHEYDKFMFMKDQSVKVDELKRANALARKYIPKSDLEKIQANILYSDITCDYHMMGIAYAGNNTDFSKCTLNKNPSLPRRKLRRKSQILKSTPRNVYKTYSDYDDSF